MLLLLDFRVIFFMKPGVVRGFTLQNSSGGGEHGGSVFQKAVYGVPSVEFHVFIHHHKDNYPVYSCVIGRQKNSAYLLNRRC